MTQQFFDSELGQRVNQVFPNVAYDTGTQITITGAPTQFVEEIQVLEPCILQVEIYNEVGNAGPGRSRKSKPKILIIP